MYRHLCYAYVLHVALINICVHILLLVTHYLCLILALSMYVFSCTKISLMVERLHFVNIVNVRSVLYRSYNGLQIGEAVLSKWAARRFALLPTCVAMATAAPAWLVVAKQRVKTSPVFTMADRKVASGPAPWTTGKRYSLAASGWADVKSHSHVR